MFGSHSARAPAGRGGPRLPSHRPPDVRCGLRSRARPHWPLRLQGTRRPRHLHMGRIARHVCTLWMIWRQHCPLHPPAYLLCVTLRVGCHITGPRSVSATETLGTVSLGAMRPPGGFICCHLPGSCGNAELSAVSLGCTDIWSSLPGAKAVGGWTVEPWVVAVLRCPHSPPLAGSPVETVGLLVALSLVGLS